MSTLPIIDAATFGSRTTGVRKPAAGLVCLFGAAAAVFFVIFFGTISPAHAQTDFSVDRQLIELHAEPGDEAIGSFRVHNRGAVPVPIEVVPVDYAMDEQGRVMTPAAGSTERSLLPHIVVSPTRFTVAPGQYADVRYVVDVPENMEGTHWMAFLIRRGDRRPSGVEERAGDGINVRFRFHVVYRTLLTVTANGTEQFAGRVTGLRQRDADDGFSFAVDVRNEGNAVFRGVGRVEIRDVQGATLSTAPLESASILPGQWRTLSTRRPINGLPPGEYIALAVVDFGGDYLIAGQRRFVVR